MKKAFATVIKTVDPVTGEPAAFAGPIVFGRSKEDAHEYCQENGLGLCHIVGEYVVGQADHMAEDVWEPVWVVLDPEEAFMAIAALKTVEKITRHSTDWMEKKIPLIDLARRTWQKLSKLSSVHHWHASQHAREILTMMYKLDDISAERDYRSCMTITDIIYDNKLYSSVYTALAAARLPETTWSWGLTEREIAGVLPYVQFSEGYEERHRKALEEMTMQKFSQEPYRSLLLSEQNLNFVDPDAGICYVDSHGQVVREAVDMTEIFTRIQKLLQE